MKAVALVLVVGLTFAAGAAAEASHERGDGRILFVPLATTTHSIIRTVDPDSGTTTTLVSAGIDTAYPTPSPNGRRLALTRSSTSTRSRGLFVADANGRNARRIATQPVRTPTWSPDGSRLAYVWDRVAIRRADGRLVRRWPLRNVWQVEWSPRGGRLVISRGAAAPSLQLVSPDGQVLRTLRKAPVDEAFLSPQWSPDGRHIVYEHDTGCANQRCGGAQGIEVIDLQGRVVQSLGPGSYPVFSPSGTKLAYLSADARGDGIFIRSLVDGSTRKVWDGGLEYPAIGWQVR